LGIELIGVVERDDTIIIAANTGEPVIYNSKSKAGQAFDRIASRVCGEKVPIPALAARGFWDRLTRRLGV
jgi:septum site-determining protein MinD